MLQDGQTALHQAASAGHADTVSALLLAGCDASVQDFAGRTALQRAAAEGHLDIVRQLVKQGASIDHQDDVVSAKRKEERKPENNLLSFPETLSHFYSSHDLFSWQIDCVRLLIFVVQHGNTALHEAAWKGFSQTVAVLCKAKANFYIKNRGGFAPLHLCCQNGHNETCRLLLLHGCKPDIKNNVSCKAVKISQSGAVNPAAATEHKALAVTKFNY